MVCSVEPVQARRHRPNGQLTLAEIGRSADARMGLCCIALIAAGRFPRFAPVCAIVASGLSLLETSNATHEGVRFPLFTELIVLPVLFGVLLAGRTWHRWPAAGAAAVAGLAIALRSHEAPISAIVAISMAVLLGVATTGVVYMRLRDSQRQTSIEHARQSERLDLARELHDVVGHHVTGIVVLAQASRFSNADTSSQTNSTLAQIEAAGLETLTSVRRLIGLLRTEPSTSAGPQLADIELLVDGLRSSHPSTDFVVDRDVRANWVPPDLAHTVERLVQEATTNVRRHGDPTALVRIAMGHPAGTVELTVENRMLHDAADTGYGLVGMRERVGALGGTFRAGPDGNGQWIVHAQLPVVEPAG